LVSLNAPANRQFDSASPEQPDSADVASERAAIVAPGVIADDAAFLDLHPGKYDRADRLALALVGGVDTADLPLLRIGAGKRAARQAKDEITGFLRDLELTGIGGQEVVPRGILAVERDVGRSADIRSDERLRRERQPYDLLDDGRVVDVIAQLRMRIVAEFARKIALC